MFQKHTFSSKGICGSRGSMSAWRDSPSALMKATRADTSLDIGLTHAGTRVEVVVGWTDQIKIVLRRRGDRKFAFVIAHNSHLWGKHEYLLFVTILCR